MRLFYIFVLLIFFLYSHIVSADCFITVFLKIGSKGVEVQCLQKKVGVIQDGIFGPLTKVAVKNFQLNNGLVADGIVGPLSRVILNDINDITAFSQPSPVSLPPIVSLSAPIITNLSTTTIQNGDKITIYGKNFSRSNTVLLSPIDFPDKYTNIISTDGTFLQITISVPISESFKNIQKDDPEIHQEIIDKIKSVKSEGADGWYLSATVSIVNENGVSNSIPVKINILNGV